MTADQEKFRQLIGCFATGVTVVTTVDSAGRPQGMTASAVSSVSLEPPLLLVCIDKAADFHPVMTAAKMFAVNVLAADQESTARRFADRAPDRFASVDMHLIEDLPHLDGCVAHLRCEKRGEFDAGDHTIFIGLVVAGETQQRSPLLHYRGRYTATE